MARPASDVDRRQLLTKASIGASFLSTPAFARSIPGSFPRTAAPAPIGDVRLSASPYKDAVDANLRYLLFLQPDRFLHNYHKFAGLPVKGALYGGWESDTIAGEGLGHYLSALALMHGQTGNDDCKVRIDYIIDELVKVQTAQGDGYCAGFLRKRKDGSRVNGKEIFPEIRAGDIRSSGFDLNGAWSPLYNIHKVFAGLLDAHELTGNSKALMVAERFGGYVENVFSPLTDAQTQAVLSCEYGGLNESFAELFARTKHPRWLRLSERIYDRKVLDPVTAGRDELANLHANTQIPKIVGLARLYELSAEPKYADASNNFWKIVTQHHTFVIGGNGDREYFFEPDTTIRHITEQTCEHCASYNMLKLTRHVYSWNVSGSYFDYYERTHLNHILAAQNPKTGMFTYMTPLMSGADRNFSSPETDFWCCVLTGMESHAKHGDSIYWYAPGFLLVNLYIPSSVFWRKEGAKFELRTGYPYDGHVDLVLQDLHREKRFSVALRVPAWADGATVHVNGAAAPVERQSGYIVVTRRWRAGDSLTLDLPMKLRIEPAPADERTVSVLRGPMLLGADLAPADQPFDENAPALVGDALLGGFVPVSGQEAVYRTDGVSRPDALTLRPFYAQWDRRSAVYFKRYSPSEWATVHAAYSAEQARLRDIAARSVDVVHLGEMQSEHDHNLRSDQSYPLVYRGRNGRDARSGGFLEFDMKATRDGKALGPLTLEMTYWGSEANRSFKILVDGVVVANEVLAAKQPGEWMTVDHAVPEALTRGKNKVTIRVQPDAGKAAGPIFGVSLFTRSALGDTVDGRAT